MMDDTKKQEIAVELAKFHNAIDEGDLRGMLRSFKRMDDGGVFQELDEYTGYTPADEVLQKAGRGESVRLEE